MLKGELISVKLTESAMFLLYRAVVCETLDNMGYLRDAWELSSALDASFEELKGNCISKWPEIIQRDADEYKHACPEDFLTVH